MKIKFAITALCAALLTGCGVAIKYSLSGASIPPDAKTFSVAYFPNNATMVAPILSSTLTDALVDMFTRRTRLMQVEEGGDFAFEGEITNYMSATSSVSTDDYAVLNRLSITVKVRFTNALDEKCRSTDVHGFRGLRIHAPADRSRGGAHPADRRQAGDGHFPGFGFELVNLRGNG
ncbi:MAG: LptE family protein [Alistipes finegoldii]